MDFTFKRLTEENVDDNTLNQMAEIEKQGDLKIKNKSEIKSLLSKLDYSLGCFCGDKLVGYIQLIKKHYLRDDLYIQNFIIDENYREQGVDTKIFKKAFEDYIKDCNITLITADIDKTNPEIPLYDKLGFEKSVIRSRNGRNHCVIVNTQYRIKGNLKMLDYSSSSESFFNLIQ